MIGWILSSFARLHKVGTKFASHRHHPGFTRMEEQNEECPDSLDGKGGGFQQDFRSRPEKERGPVNLDRVCTGRVHFAMHVI